MEDNTLTTRTCNQITAASCMWPIAGPITFNSALFIPGCGSIGSIGEVRVLRVGEDRLCKVGDKKCYLPNQS
jgi:hypothetical protein